MAVRRALRRPALTVAALIGSVCGQPRIYPFLGLAFFPRTDAGQFTINLKVPTGTRIEMTEQYVAKIEDLIRHTVDPHDLKMVVSNIGVVPDFSALYTTNAGPLHRHRSGGARPTSTRPAASNTWTGCGAQLAAQLSRISGRSFPADRWWTPS